MASVLQNTLEHERTAAVSLACRHDDVIDADAVDVKRNIRDPERRGVQSLRPHGLRSMAVPCVRLERKHHLDQVA